MIELDNVTKVYAGAGGTEVRAVDSVSLRAGDGDFVMILGRSGSGKSTLLGMIAGLIRPAGGSVRVGGRDLMHATFDELAELRAGTIGFVFQFSGLVPTLTAAENVLLPTLFASRKGAGRAEALELLRKVGVGDRADAYPGTLSSGEMKRVAIARALVNGPRLVIADEPTGDLDEATEAEIIELFRQLHAGGITIVMVTHNPDLIPCATRTYRMERGRLEPLPEAPCGSPS